MLEPNETIFVRGLYGGKWKELIDRFDTLSDEVFAEVMEAEMELAGVKPKDLEENFDTDVINKHRTSLL